MKIKKIETNETAAKIEVGTKRVDGDIDNNGSHKGYKIVEMCGNGFFKVIKDGFKTREEAEKEL